MHRSKSFRIKVLNQGSVEGFQGGSMNRTCRNVCIYEHLLGEAVHNFHSFGQGFQDPKRIKTTALKSGMA